MRAIAVHEDVVVAIGAIWKTTCTAVRAGDEAFLIDSPILPDELEALPALLDQAGFAVSGLLVTHADWDHLLGRYAFPQASIGCGETTAARLTAEPGAAQRELREFDEQYLIDRPGPLSLPGVQALPVPGYCVVGRARAGAAPGRRAHERRDGRLDSVGRRARRRRLPVAGRDPRAVAVVVARRVPRDAAAAGAAGRAGDDVVPGHGEPLDSARAAAILREDLAYVEALAGEDPASAPLPLARRDGGNRKLHEYNVSLLGGD